MKPAVERAPSVGLLPVMDPRIEPELQVKLLGHLQLAEKLRSLGIDVVWPGRVVTTEEDAVEQVDKMQAAGVCGIIYFTGWFLRANVIVGAAQHSHLPLMVWSIPNLDDASLIGFGVTHGSLDEVGIPHEIVCDVWNEASQRKMLAWSRACRVKQLAASARYGHIGGKCLSMMTADADANQWRRQFGIDVDHAEQWTLIHEAEAIPEAEIQPCVRQWKRRVRGRRRLRRSAGQVGAVVSGRQGHVRPQWLGLRGREVPVRTVGQLSRAVPAHCPVERRRNHCRLRDRHERGLDHVRPGPRQWAAGDVLGHSIPQPRRGLGAVFELRHRGHTSGWRKAKSRAEELSGGPRHLRPGQREAFVQGRGLPALHSASRAGYAGPLRPHCRDDMCCT